MRLFKLLRILRSGRVFRRLEDILKMGYAMMTLLKFIFGTLAIAHWMACAWMMVQGLEGSCTNWIITYFPPRFDDFGEEVDFCGPIPQEECQENDYQFTCTDCETCDCSSPCGKYYEVRQTYDVLPLAWPLLRLFSPSAVAHALVLVWTSSRYAGAIAGAVLGDHCVSSLCDLVLLVISDDVHDRIRRCSAQHPCGADLHHHGNDLRNECVCLCGW